VDAVLDFGVVRRADPRLVHDLDPLDFRGLLKDFGGGHRILTPAQNKHFESLAGGQLLLSG